MAGAGLGIGLSLLSGCFNGEKAKPGIYLTDAQPTGVRYVIHDGVERFVRDRKLVRAVDSNGHEEYLTIAERQLPGTNRWELIAADRPNDQRMYDLLRKKLPRLADVMTDFNQSIGDVRVEDSYDANGEVTGTRFYLPGGETEDLK